MSAQVGSKSRKLRPIYLAPPMLILVGLVLFVSGVSLMAKQPAADAVTPPVRVIAILAKDASQLPPGLGPEFPRLVSEHGGRFGFSGAVISQLELPTAHPDALLSRATFLSLAADPAARQMLLDFMRPGKVLMVMQTSPQELQRALNVSLATTGWPAGYEPQMSSMTWRQPGQWSAGVTLQPEGKVNLDPADIIRSALGSIDSWDRTASARGDE